MMKGKSGRSTRVGSSTLAYPGNAFVYSPKFPNDEPDENLNVFDGITTTLHSPSYVHNVTNSNTLENSEVPLSGTVGTRMSQNIPEDTKSERFEEIKILVGSSSVSVGKQKEKVMMQVLNTMGKHIKEKKVTHREQKKETKTVQKKRK